MGRPKKEDSLTPNDVVQAAIACIDQEGAAALGINRVARRLGVKPPALYKHINGKAALERAVAIMLWQDYLDYLEQQNKGLTDSTALMFSGAQATRQYAKEHFARYCVMMGYQMKPTDPEEAAIIGRSLQVFKSGLHIPNDNENALIDTMRMVNAAIYGFIMREQSDLMTLKRSADDSFDVMLEALLVAAQHICNQA